MVPNESSPIKSGCANAFNFKKFLSLGVLRTGLSCGYHLCQDIGCWPHNRTRTICENLLLTPSVGLTHRLCHGTSLSPDVVYSVQVHTTWHILIHQQPNNPAHAYRIMPIYNIGFVHLHNTATAPITKASINRPAKRIYGAQGKLRL